MKKWLILLLLGAATVAFAADMKGKIGLEDLAVGTGTFERRTSSGGTVTMTEINATNLGLTSGEVTITWDEITDTPTTLAGYGITDAGAQDNVAITGGTIDNTRIGNTTPAYGHFSDLSADYFVTTNGIMDNVVIGNDYPQYGAFAPFVGTGVNIDNGSIDNVIIGETVPEIGYFTTLTSTYASFDDLAVASGFTSGGTSTVSGLFYSESLWVNDNVLIGGETNINGPLTVAGDITISGEIISLSYSTTAADGEHFINVANSTAPTDNVAVGDCYFDNTTTSNTWLCYNGTAWVEPTVHTKDFVIYGYSASHDNVVRWKADSAQTLTQLDCITGGADNVTVTLYECDGNAANCSTTGLVSAATSSNVADTSASNGGIDAGDWIKASLSTLQGTASSVACTVRYLVTRQ